MQIGITTIVCSILYSILIVSFYFSKKRINSIENKMYVAIIIINFISLILELCCCYLAPSKELYPALNFIVNRLFLISILYWVTVFGTYIFYVSHDNDRNISKIIKNNMKKIFLAIFILYIVSFAVVFFLELSYYYDGMYVYSYGKSTEFVFGYVSLYVLIALIS